MKHAERTSVSLGSVHLELAGREREEIGRNGLGFRVLDADAPGDSLARHFGAVGGRLPAGGYRQFESEACLEVGLVERRKRQMRPRRHEQRVQKVWIAIERRVARTEHDLHDVLAGPHFFVWNDDMTVDGAES